MNRRGFLTGFAGLLAAPAIVRVGSLMPISVPKLPEIVLGEQMLPGATWRIGAGSDFMLRGPGILGHAMKKGDLVQVLYDGRTYVVTDCASAS